MDKGERAVHEVAQGKRPARGWVTEDILYGWLDQAVARELRSLARRYPKNSFNRNLLAIAACRLEGD